MSAQRPNDPRSRRGPSQEVDEVLENLRAWAAFIMSNLLWVFASLPIVTLPAATAGLVAVMNPWVRGARPEPMGTFIKGFREQGLRGTWIALHNLLIVGFLAFNLLVTQAEATPLMLAARGLAFASLIFLAAVNVYLWPLLGRLERPVFSLWQVAVKLVFLRPLPALLSVCAGAAVVAASLLLPKAVALLFSVSAVMYCLCYGAKWGTDTELV